MRPVDEDLEEQFVGRRRVALMLLKQHLGELAAKRPVVLDLGCGTGVVSRDLDMWATAVSLDMSPIALGYCKKRGLKRLMLGDGAHLPIQSESVDAVIALDIYEHIPDHVSAFKETYRALKPGGVLVMSVPAFNMLWGPHDVAVHHCRRYRRKEVANRLEEAGFSVERLTYSVFFLFPLVALVRLLG
jgi:SAM-dependent methyltransferase